MYGKLGGARPIITLPNEITSYKGKLKQGNF